MASKLSGQAFTQSFCQENKVQALQFGLLSPDTIAKMSVAEIRSPVVYDDQGMPNYQAINDPRMGVINRESRCMTCKGTQVDCPGHFGHIELTYPVFHAGLFPYILKFLRSVCFNCSKLLAPRDQNEVHELLKIRRAKTRFQIITKMAASVFMCDSDQGGCGYKQPKFRRDGLKLEIEYQHDNFDKTRDRKEMFWPDQAQKVLSRITDQDSKLLGLDPTYMRPEWVIIKNLAVAPPPVRPSVVATATLRSEDDLTFAYQSVIKINRVIRDQLEKGANMTTINELRTVLQFYVCSIMDNRMPGNQVQKHKSGKPLKSIRERLKGKEGRLRGNLMGKRVDFSARTVITPDPNLKLDELGVPHKVATGLTVPEYVTPQNMHVLRQLVENGPTHWPGAKYIIRSDERQIDLSYLRMRSDVHLEPGYIVERHLQDGDYVLFNRQPSLHKMSIMGHRVKVLPQNTFRLNLSVTTPYNADFDGDEMNMHVPQSYETMAEIKEIMAVPTQIMSPQSNKPVMGVVQDSLLGVMIFTLRDTFLDKETVMNLLMWVNCEYQIPQPAIIKPKSLWTGKQLFSLILPKVNLLRYKSQPWDSYKDSNILIEDGELLCGVMTKAIVGSTGQGLVHIIWKEHGHSTCSEWLSSVQNVLNNWLVNNGFTVGVQDIIVKKDTSEKIQSTLAKFKRRVMSIVSQANAGKLKSQPGKSMMQSFEVQVNKKLNDARDKSGNLALEGLVSYNRLRNMVTAGSKGSNINISQIMACVGQQNVEGKRIPYGFNKRSLPHFSKDDFGPESKGFVQSCYLTGLSPSEFYFHAMGGREGLIDTAVKTAETGYISRRLIKALEDVMVNYDGTVRDSRKEILQFLYGEDGISGEHVEDLPLELLKINNQKLEAECKFIPDTSIPEVVLKQMLKQSMVDGNVNDIFKHQDQLFKAFEREYNQIKQDRQFLRDSIMKDGSDQTHLPINLNRMIWNAKKMFQIKPNSRTDLHPSYVIDKVKSLCSDLTVIPGAKVLNASQIIRDHDTNSHQLLNIYVRHMLCSAHMIQKERLNKGSFDWLLSEIKSRFEQSQVQPGEMVGSIAAQSMGEPATQMTLNTFHFAGISTKNVTLGVPRLREIINVASNIKTPSLKIYLKDKYRKKENVVTKLGGLIEHTTLNHVVSSSGIYYDPDPEKTIIPEDQILVNLYNEVPVIDEESAQKPSPWLLRFELDADRMVHKDLSIAQIDKKMHETFMDTINLMVSDENSERLIMRMRVNNIEDDDEQTVPSYLKEFEEQILTELTLKGFHEIDKVTFTKCHENCYDKNGQAKVTDENWVIETDGIALAKILSVNKVDNTKTTSNDLLEVLKVIGIEAARQSLINELRLVFSSYGIYVNYRHVSTLCDIMTQRGKLTSITRHGINRVDSGPLRKCSFEETVEILLEGSIYAEKDVLSGITENVIMGQLAHFGSGSIDIKLDFDCVEKNAKTNIGQDLLNRFNAMQDEAEDSPTYNPSMTPLMMTPQNAKQAAIDSSHSMISSMYSPNADGVFTPAAQDMQSPEYGSPYAATSPAYGNLYSAQSPIYGGVSSPAYGQANLQSPIYQGGFQSPVYNQGNRVVSPGYAPSSPIAVCQVPVKPITSISPSYSPSSMQSPAYNMTDANKKRVVSPAYSPSIMSPAYNSNANMSSSHNYSAYQGASPAYLAQMSDGKQAYIPSSMEGSAQSSSRAANFMKSPAYIPGSPTYNAVINSPDTSVINGGLSPANECKFIHSIKKEPQQENNSN